MSPFLREVQAPYTVNADDEAIGRETILIRRNGEPVAAVVPYAEYQELLALKSSLAPPPHSDDAQFDRERAAFRRLLPELLKTHRGQWVAVVNEQAVAFGPNFQSVIVPVRRRFGQRSVYVQEIREVPRVHRIPSPRIVHR